MPKQRVSPKISPYPDEIHNALEVMRKVHKNIEEKKNPENLKYRGKGKGKYKKYV